MSRARQSSTGRLSLATAAVGIALALAGCGAGQISQTAGMEPAVNGGIGQVGDIAVRDIQLAYPDHGVYERGASAVILGSVINSGLKDDELVSVTSSHGTVTISGDKKLPAGRALISDPRGARTATATATTTSTSSPAGTTTTPSGPTTSGSPTGTTTPPVSVRTSPTTTATSTTTSAPRPTSIGKITMVLTGLAEELRSGQTVELTFVFSTSGQVTVNVPIAVPTTPRAPAKEGH